MFASFFTFFNTTTNLSTASFSIISDLVPVHTIFPLLNNRNVALVPCNLNTNPGNCSGSYSVLGSFNARKLRFKSILMSPEATIFWTLIFGLTLILIFILARFLIIFCRDSFTLVKDFAPVQTTFPELKIKADVFGSFILITNPGNCSGLYSVLGNVSASFIKGISCSREVETTMFCIFISGLVDLFAIMKDPLSFFIYKLIERYIKVVYKERFIT